MTRDRQPPLENWEGLPLSCGVESVKLAARNRNVAGSDRAGMSLACRSEGQDEEASGYSKRAAVNHAVGKKEEPKTKLSNGSTQIIPMK